ncbi:MAG: GntR family transcriptional regulator [Oscillospiraceae bacterium]|nr:GntR family transcriptional regulator [Oscillospiraceae bacterium]
MTEFKTASLADQVFDKLENDIIMGVYPRGEVLTELKLVEQLNVSRTPIREALRRLEQERLIDISGKRYVVLGITQEDLADIMDIRVYAEALASYYATKNATPETLAKLLHIVQLQEFYVAQNDGEHLHLMDDQFHDCICAMCGRGVIRDTLMPLHRKTKRFRKASIQQAGRVEQTIREHRAIYEAIASGDAEQAKELTAQHIRQAKQNMMKRMGFHE